jgi:hypothetical protein
MGCRETIQKSSIFVPDSFVSLFPIVIFPDVWNVQNIVFRLNFVVRKCKWFRMKIFENFNFYRIFKVWIGFIGLKIGTGGGFL